MLSWRLVDFLEQAAAVKIFWTEAGSHANRKGKDFVQQAADLSGALLEADAWQVCEPWKLKSSPLSIGLPVDVMVSLLTKRRATFFF